MTSRDLLDVKDLVTSFAHTGGRSSSAQSDRVVAVDGVSFSIKAGQTLGVVGESGCGKSVTSLSILRLIDAPIGRIDSGEVWFDGVDLLSLSESEVRRMRGQNVAMIFQEPMTSLNPVFTVGDQIGEVFRVHQGASRRLARSKAIDMLRMVKIPAPESRVDDYPHQLSGGMRQRVMIAMALACQPKLLIADEPTTALDVTVQAQILDLMNDLQKSSGMAIMLITHDLGVVAEVCDEVAVMYAGRIVERGRVEDIFENPRHPYTAGLLKSIPQLGRRVDRLPTIEGHVPSLGNLPSGCAFRNRCVLSAEICAQSQPKETTIDDNGHSAACFFVD